MSVLKKSVNVISCRVVLLPAVVDHGRAGAFVVLNFASRN